MASGVVSKEILQIQFLQLHWVSVWVILAEHKLLGLELVKITEQEERHSLKFLYLKSVSLHCTPFDLWTTKNNLSSEPGWEGEAEEIKHSLKGTISCHSTSGWDTACYLFRSFFDFQIASFFLWESKNLPSDSDMFQMSHFTILQPPCSIIFYLPAIIWRASHCGWGTTPDGCSISCVKLCWQKDCTGSIDLLASAWTWASTLKYLCLQCK